MGIYRDAVIGVALLAILKASAALAQEAQSAPPPPPSATEPVIIVQGNRGSAIEDIAPLAEFDADAIAAIGAQSVDELNRAIQGQTRSADGSDPILLLNAQRVSGYEEIQSLPPEAIEKIEILPEPAALRYGFPPTRRVVNYITKRRFAQIEARVAAGTTLPVGRGTQNVRAGYTRLRGDARVTGNVEWTHSDRLFISERHIDPDPAVPFDPIGNVTGLNGAEIDPALSRLAGIPVAIAPVPLAPSTRGLLAAYAAAANVPRPFDLGRTATLAPANDTIKGEAVLAAPVGETLGGSLTFTLERSLDRALGGPAAAALLLGPSTPYSPFEAPVVLNRYLTEAAPLRQRDERTTLTAGATLRGAIAGWQWDATASLNRSVQQGLIDRRIDPAAANMAIAAGTDPFAPLRADLLADRILDQTRQQTSTVTGKVVARNDPVRLPAGRATVTATVEAARLTAASSLRGSDRFDLRLGRTQSEAGLSANLPLTSRSEEVLATLGDLSANASANVRHVQQFGTLVDTTVGLTWMPIKGLQLLANLRRAEKAPDLVQLSSPPRTVENVPLFDFGSGRTQVVTLLLGGNPDLRAERRRVRSVSFSYKPFEDSQLRFGGSYETASIRNQTGTIVAITPQIERLLPELFTRDASGRLLSVAYRPVNFDYERQRKLQVTLTSSGRIGAPPTPAAEGGQAPLDQRASYYLGIVPTYAFEDRLRLRPGAAFLDLLDGDTIGTYAPRVSGYAYGGTNRQGYGATFSIYYGGPRRIRSDDPSADLRFLSILQLGLAAYMPVHDLLPRQVWTRQLQLRLETANLLDSRQRVQDRNGEEPNQYQTDLIDPLGRTVTVSLRKRF